MRFLLHRKKTLSLAMIVSLLSMTILSSPVRARMVSTCEVLNSGSHDSDRERIKSFLEREDVQGQLEAWGLEKEAALAGVDSLTDQEVSRMARQLDQLPAGGDGVGTVVVASILIFLILLVTDILGLTDVFPFVKKGY